MKVIIAGSRSIVNVFFVQSILNPLKDEIPITEVVCGKAGGVDSLGEDWADRCGIPVVPFPADWNDLTAPGALIRTNKWNKQYNARAGFDRNEKMAQYAEVLILIWTGSSPGSRDMRERAINHKLKIYEFVVSPDGRIERRS